MLVMVLSCSDEQGDIIGSKGLLIISHRPSIFAGAKTKGEGGTHHIGYHFVFQHWICLVGKKESADDECDGNRLDTDGRRVVLFKQP